jgi:arsenical pump membrane protein
VTGAGSAQAGSEHEAGPAAAGPRWLTWLLALAGIVGAGAVLAVWPKDARLAAAQDWSPFVLVAGLLLIGLTADKDGLFAFAGRQLGRVARHGTVLFAGAVVIIAVVTATLNLDTSVAFLTPVLVYTAASQRTAGSAGAPGAAGVVAGSALLYGALLLSNAGSLLLPGSNLTNLIVLGHLQLTGGQFVARMWLPWLAAVASTAAVVAIGERRSLRTVAVRTAAVRTGAMRTATLRTAAVSSVSARAPESAEPAELARRPVLGAGLAAVLLATVLVVTLASPALAVAAIGVVAAGIRLAQRRVTLAQVREVLGLPVLIGLFGVAVALGAVGRAWAGPAAFMSHLDGWASAAVAGLSTVLLNNLPAASLLAARAPGHPLFVLVGLNLGPNLFVTGSLAWLLWLRAARAAGARPSVARASRLGLVAVPLSMALALAALTLTGAS